MARDSTEGFDPTDPKLLVTRDELSQILGVDERTIKKWTREGLPCEKTAWLRFYSPVACRAWAQQNLKPLND